MKEKTRKFNIQRGLLVFFLCAAIVFCGLWIESKNELPSMEQQCQYSAYRAYERFSAYQNSGSAYDYDYGVSELVSFYNCYMNLVTGATGSTDTNCVYLNQLLGELMYKPELTADQIAQLVDISGSLNRDIYDINAYHQIFSLYNELAR